MDDIARGMMRVMEKEENDEGNIGVAEGVDVKSLTTTLDRILRISANFLAKTAHSQYNCWQNKTEL